MGRDEILKKAEELNDFLMDISKKVEGMYPSIDGTYHTIREKICEVVKICSEYKGDDEGELQGMFREITDPAFRQSWAFSWARSWPKGYPGDFKILESIYEGFPKGKGLGGYLDIFGFNTKLARAVKHRMETMGRILSMETYKRNGNLRVLNVASGPCREYFMFKDHLDFKRTEFVCLDMDEEAFDYVKDRLEKENIRGKFEFVKGNALRFDFPSLGKFDIIYSVGLMDYVEDSAVKKMLISWKGMLNPDGIIVVSFKDAERYDKTFYQWFANWYFLQRNYGDILNLLKESGFSEIVPIRESTGSIVLFVLKP